MDGTHQTSSLIFPYFFDVYLYLSLVYWWCRIPITDTDLDRKKGQLQTRNCPFDQRNFPQDIQK